MKLHVLPAGPIQTNAYLLTASERGEAVLIDAPGDVWPEVEAVLRDEQCRLTELWITHGHRDHTQGGAEVVRRSGAKVRAHVDDRVLIETPEIMERFLGERLNLEPLRVDGWVGQGERLSLRLVRAARSGDDQQVELVPVAPGLYDGRLARPLHGRWHLQLEDAGYHWRLAATAQMPADAVIGLEPAPMRQPAAEEPRWSDRRN